MADPAATTPPLRLGSKFNCGLGAAARGIAYAALFGAVLQYYLNQVMRLPAILVGAAIMASLIADAVIDPLIGQWLDNLQSKWGRRHPFMYASAFLASAAFYSLWHAPRALSGMVLLGYVLVLLVALRIAVSIFDVPNNALMPELEPDYDRRTVLSSFRWFFFIFGAAGMSFLLNGVFLRKDASHPLGLLNLTGYEQFGTLGAVLIFIAIMWSSLGTHERIKHLHRPPTRKATLAQTLSEIGTTVTNPSLVVLLISGVLGGAAGRMQTGLDYYFYTHLLGPPADPAGHPPDGGLAWLDHRGVRRPAAVQAVRKKGHDDRTVRRRHGDYPDADDAKAVRPDVTGRIAVDLPYPLGRGGGGRDPGDYGLHHHSLDDRRRGRGQCGQDRGALGGAAVRHQRPGSQVHRRFRRLVRWRAGDAGAFPDPCGAGQRAGGADAPSSSALSADLCAARRSLYRSACVLSDRPAHPRAQP
jgi:hypothetical protein